MNTLVVIGFSEALSAPEVAWSLRDAGYDVLVIARQGRHSALRHSVHVRVADVVAPEKNLSASVSAIEQILQEHERSGRQTGLLLPLDDSALCLWSRLKLPAGWVNAGATARNAQLALDKSIQVQFAAAAGLRIPSTTIARSTADVLARRGDLPLVLRPADAVWIADGALKKGRNWICANMTELEHALAAWSERFPLMIQPFIRGVGEGVFGLGTGDGVMALSAHRRLRMMNPHGSGSSACVSQPVSDEVGAAAARLIQATGWRGLFMVELLCDDAGVRWFVELNGRPWGSMALSRRQGLDYPAWAAHLALGSHPPPCPQPGHRVPIVCRNAGRELMHLLFVLRGPKSIAVKPWPSFWRTALDILSVHHGDSFYNWRRDDPKVFFSDCWYTVRNTLHSSRN